MGAPYLIFAGLALAVLVLICLKPGVLIRAPIWLITHTAYRLRVVGGGNMPAQGPALLVCNHVTYLDWLFVFGAQKRHVHFVIFAGWTKVWGLRRILKWAGVIPIDQWAGPRAIVQSLRQAGEALQRGEVVCIFAEGRFTRTGFLLPFHRGFAQIVKHCPTAPIIPVCLEQAWGSIFSFWGGKLIWKRPQEFPYPVTVAFGAPMPASAQAAEVRAAVQKLSADCAVERSLTLRPVHRQFARLAGRWNYFFRPCMRDGLSKKKALTYGQALTRAICLARSLRPRLGETRNIGIWAAPTTHAALANIAVALLGKTVVNLDSTAPHAHIRSALGQCGIRHVLTTREFVARSPLQHTEVEPIFIDEILSNIGRGRRFLTSLGIYLLPRFVLERWLGLGHYKGDDLATVIFAGADSDSKGIMLSQRNIAANVESLIQVVNAHSSDRLLAVLPLSQSFGYVLTFWAPLQEGASLVFHADGHDAKGVGALCKKHRCTIFLATPDLLRRCLQHCGPDDFRSLRFLWCGADKLPLELAISFAEKFGVLPMEGYGATELSAAASVNVPDQELEGFRQIGNKPGTIGQPLPGVAARIVDPETFAPLATGKEGLLLFFGPNVMAGYLNQPEATQRVIRDGWYVTGERATMDEDGFITLAK